MMSSVGICQSFFRPPEISIEDIDPVGCQRHRIVSLVAEHMVILKAFHEKKGGAAAIGVGNANQQEEGTDVTVKKVIACAILLVAVAYLAFQMDNYSRAHEPLDLKRKPLPPPLPPPPPPPPPPPVVVEAPKPLGVPHITLDEFTGKLEKQLQEDMQKTNVLYHVMDGSQPLTIRFIFNPQLEPLDCGGIRLFGHEAVLCISGEKPSELLMQRIQGLAALYKRSITMQIEVKGEARLNGVPLLDLFVGV